MAYCDDCILIDICGAEDLMDEALTFCNDKNRFVPVSVIEDIKAELWYSGVNMVEEYQGVWVRYRDIEKAFDKHISGKEKE